MCVCVGGVLGGLTKHSFNYLLLPIAEDLLISTMHIRNIYFMV